MKRKHTGNAENLITCLSDNSTLCSNRIVCIIPFKKTSASHCTFRVDNKKRYKKSKRVCICEVETIDL